jgi:UPF0755 protein
MKKNHYYSGLFFVLFIGAIGAWLHVLYTPVVLRPGGQSYYVHQGTSKKTLIAALAQQGMMDHPFLFTLYAYLHRNAQLKTGEYFFPQGATPASIWWQITTGSGLLYRPFTIIPGWTFKQLRAELLKAQGLRQTTATLTNTQIMARLGRPALSPEGEFFPDTYYYTRGNADFIILKRAFALMQSTLNQAWQQRSAGLPYKNAYDALIVASMVEKEAHLDSERPTIAGIMMNRLNRNMLLQIDATVIYGLGDRYTGKLHKEDLLENTIYNTYTQKGLPPTPIAMPGAASIRSAMAPQQNNYYYYVAKGDGSHQFSSSLQEHQAAVQALLAKQKGGALEGTVRTHLELSKPNQHSAYH